MLEKVIDECYDTFLPPLLMIPDALPTIGIGRFAKTIFFFTTATTSQLLDDFLDSLSTKTRSVPVSFASSACDE